MKKGILLLVLLSFFNFAATYEKVPDVSVENEVQKNDLYLEEGVMDELRAISAMDEDGAVEGEEPVGESPEPEGEEDNE